MTAYERLADVEEIKKLKARYCRFVDKRGPSVLERDVWRLNPAAGEPRWLHILPHWTCLTHCLSESPC
ncbi:hypothetical protein PV341_15110 [Streptomyces sp. PA03-1a]|nr:hypothetical protein [Streptomyces sp. PA03-1a]MDX2818427.1 hypothetical protein [Streptomyces sp. PA03-5A]